MKVKFFGELSEYGEIELNASSMKEILSLTELTLGRPLVDKLLTEKYYFILANSLKLDDVVPLAPEVIFSDFTGYDSIYIIPELEGEITAAMLAPLLVGWAAVAAATVINLAIAVGLNMIMSAISPTPEFSSDPAYSQNKSNLFNGAPIVREQGGSVPLIFGRPYCGGVLISSGLFSEEG